MVTCVLLMANTDSFVEWLQGELDQRGWNESELARQAKGRGYNLSSSALTRIYKGERGIGPKIAAAIAAALDLPHSVVFERAGLLVAGPDYNPEKEELNSLWDRLPPEQRRMGMELFRQMVRQQEEEQARKRRRKPLADTQ